jgi:hypothetical protein
VFAVTAWFPGGATISQPYTGSVPGPSQNRTWSVTPSGSQSESSTAFHSGRLLPALAPEALVQPLRVKYQTPQRIEPQLRLCTCFLCETVQSCCHGHNPPCVGPCLLFPLSDTGTPSLCPHYQASSLLWVPPTSDSHRPLPRFLHLSEGAQFPPRRLPDLPGSHTISI